MRRIKILLAVGTLAASVVGTNLVAQKETTAPQQAVSATVVTIPKHNDNNRGEQQLRLPPVATAIAPAFRPVARSRSSR
jgi:hypothetical protein